MSSSDNRHIPQETLRRLATRVLDVIARNKDRSTAIAQFESILAPSAKRFSEVYDSVLLHDSTRNGKRREGLMRVQTLHRLVQEWRGLLGHDIAGFDTLRFDANVPADVIGNTERLMQLLEDRQASGEERLVYGDELLAKLTEARETASAAWTEAENARIAHQELQAEAREAAGALHKKLIAFRRTLRNTLGSSHYDYQSLRAARSEREDDEVSTPMRVAPEPTSTVPQAPAVRDPGTNPMFRTA